MTVLKYFFDAKNGTGNVSIDTEGAMNTIDFQFIDSFEQVIAKIEESKPKVVIIKSNKKKSFITGADLKELLSSDIEKIKILLIRLNSLYGKLASSGIPVIAILNDQVALGGGFEFLLRTCDKIIATPGSSFGLPEIHLGLIPSGGGIYILERVIGLESGLNAIIRGRNFNAEELLQTGLVETYNWGEIENKITNLIGKLDKKSIRTTNPSSLPIIPEKEEQRKKIIETYLGRAVTSPHRPWLKCAVELFEKGINCSFDSFIEENISLFCRLWKEKNTKNKIDFFILKNFTFKPLPQVNFKETIECKTIGIIGAGLMGRGIAQVAADSGINVKIMDVNEEITKGAIETIKNSLQGLVKKGRWTQKRFEMCMARINAVNSLQNICDVPLIIEAIPEQLELKQELVGKIHKINPDVIFATNTSSIPIGDISKGTSNPVLVGGMHFFSPVPLMELVEVIEGKDSSKLTINIILSLATKMGKTCIVVGDGPGFYTSRVFSSFLYGGFYCVEAGVLPWEVDRIAVRAGFPRGPIHMFCSVGGMIPYHAGKFMESRNPRRFKVPESMEKAATHGYVGAGGKKGFYLDEEGTKPDETVLNILPRKQGIPVPDEKEIEDILLLGMVNEAFWIFGEGILRDIASMEIGAVLGIGFPDCFHGPARYASMRGIGNVLKCIEELYEKFLIPHLEPAPELKRLVACGVEGNLI